MCWCSSKHGVIIITLTDLDVSSYYMCMTPLYLYSMIKGPCVIWCDPAVHASIQSTNFQSYQRYCLMWHFRWSKVGRLISLICWGWGIWSAGLCGWYDADDHTHTYTRCTQNQSMHTQCNYLCTHTQWYTHIHILAYTGFVLRMQENRLICVECAHSAHQTSLRLS